MSWYYCSGCGPSMRCDVCGATECAQEIHGKAERNECPGCVRAMKIHEEGHIPWNMQILPHGVRGWKPLRKRETRRRIRRHECREMFVDMRVWKRIRGYWVKNPDREAMLSSLNPGGTDASTVAYRVGERGSIEVASKQVEATLAPPTTEVQGSCP